MNTKAKNYKFEDVLEFWFDKDIKSKWFAKDDKFDEAIIKRFFSLYDQVKEGLLDSWKKSPRGTLALIIVLDQFPRNMFRNLAISFVTDSKAIELTKYAISNEMYKELNNEEKQFLYMPLMHSEDIKDQKLSVELFSKLPIGGKYAEMHKNIIERFGRFPRRNKILGRNSTEEEIIFLKSKNPVF